MIKPSVCFAEMYRIKVLIWTRYLFHRGVWGRFMKKNVIFNIVIYLAVFLILLPLTVLILWGFSKRWPWPYVLPTEYSLRGVAYFLTGTGNSIKILLYSIGLSFVVTVITLVISVPAARALGLYEFKEKAFLSYLYFYHLLFHQ